MKHKSKLLIFCLFPAFPLIAQSVDELMALPLSDLANLQVVTASKTPRLSSDITQKVDVVAEAEMNRVVSGNRNISELIQYLPGASVKVLSRNDANWGAYGGIGPKYSTYMVQGLPVDAFMDPMGMEMMALQRIEVQRGPASVLYPNYLSQDFAGNQSPLAGTVNLILKDRVVEPKTAVSLGYGSYNTLTGQAYHENRFHGLNAIGGGSYEMSDYSNYGSPGSWLNMKKDPEYRRAKVFLGTNMYLDKAEKHKIALFGNQAFHWGNAGRTFREFDYKYSLVNVGYSGALNENLSISLKGGLRTYDRAIQEDSLSGRRQFLKMTNGLDQFIFPADLSLTFSHFNNSSFTAGTDFQQSVYSTWAQFADRLKETGNDASAIQAGVYMQEELQLKKVTLRAGGRLNTIHYSIDRLGGKVPEAKSQTWNAILWSAGAKYRVNDEFKLYANGGSSFMTPGFKSIGGTIRAEDTVSSGQLPNAGLDPEDGISLDLGFDYRLPGNVSLSSRAFYTLITNAIFENAIRQEPSQTMSVNAEGETMAHGIEFGVSQQLERKIDWFANTTFTHSEIIDPDVSDQDGTEVPFVPPLMTNLGVTFYLPYGVEVSPWMHFGGRIYDSSSKTGRSAFDSKEVINLNVLKTFKLKESREMLLFIRACNLTDNRFDMPWGFRDPGFNISAGSKIIF